MTTKLQQAVAVIKGGDRTAGRQMLTEIIQAEPRNELAWLWLANAVESAAQRRQCLQNVLKINPHNEQAKQGLAVLEKRSVRSSAEDAPESGPDSGAQTSTEDEEPAAIRPKKLRRLSTQNTFAQTAPPAETSTPNESDSPLPEEEEDVPAMSSAAALQKIASDRARGITPNLNEANLSGADLGGADLSEASLHHVNFSGASLVGANLRHSNLTGADLSRADCRNAKLNETQLNGVNLAGTDLRGANLNGSHLRYADLSGAQLHGANLGWADLTEVVLEGVSYDENTRWPDGFVVPESGVKAKAKAEMRPAEKREQRTNVKAVEAEPPAPPPMPEPETVITGPPVEEEEATQKCPYCAETIKAEVTVCRYCGSQLEHSKSITLLITQDISDRELLDNEIARRTAQGWQVVTQTATSVQFRKQKRWSTVLLLLGAVLLICFGTGLIFLLLALIDYALKKDQVLFVNVDSLRGNYTQKSNPKLTPSPSSKSLSNWSGPLILAGVLIGGFVLCIGVALLPSLLIDTPGNNNTQSTTQNSKLELPTASLAEPTPFPLGSIPVTRKQIIDEFSNFIWKVDDFKDGTHRSVGESSDRKMKILLFSEEDIENINEASFFFHFSHNVYYLEQLDEDTDFKNGYDGMLRFQSVIFPDWNSDKWAREKLQNLPAPLTTGKDVDEKTERRGVEVWISAGDLSETEYSVAFSVVE